MAIDCSVILPSFTALMLSLLETAISSRAKLWLEESIHPPRKSSSSNASAALSPKSSGNVNSLAFPKLKSFVIITPVVVSAVSETAYPG